MGDRIYTDEQESRLSEIVDEVLSNKFTRDYFDYDSTQRKKIMIFG